MEKKKAPCYIHIWSTEFTTKKKDNRQLPNIGLHDWLITSKQTEPDLQLLTDTKITCYKKD